MKKIMMMLTVVMMFVVFQGCNKKAVVGAIAEVPKQNVKALIDEIDSITLDVKMKDKKTAYYVDTIDVLENKKFVLYKTDGEKRVEIGILDLINFSITNQKKPYPETDTAMKDPE